MSKRTALILAAASLCLAVGCATGQDEEGAGNEPETTASETPEVEVEVETGVETNAWWDAWFGGSSSGSSGSQSGYSCGCAAGEEMQAGLCYPKCDAGWVGEGPVCWQRCASGFTDTGWFCQRDSKIIGADTSACPWYNKCGVASDCNKCPAGYENDGCTCRIDAYIYAQPSKGRGAGTTPSCDSY